ncbi:hypothetical protein Tco_0866795 [Tanacetum coccineum]
MEKGFPIFLAHVTATEVEDKSEKKRLEDVPIVQDFLEVFPEDTDRVYTSELDKRSFKLIEPGSAYCSTGTLSIGAFKKKELI